MWLEQMDLQNKGLKYQFLIISSLMFVLPTLILSYILYREGVIFDLYLLIVSAFILLLILAGMMILRYIFDSIFSAARLLREATESGKMISTDLKKDVAELGDVFTSFNTLLQKFEQTTKLSTQKTLELSAIKDISKAASQKINTEDLLNEVLDKALTLTNAQIGSFFVIDSQSGRLRLVGSRGLTGMEKDSYINISDSLIQHVVSEKKPLLVTDIENDARIKKKNNPRYGSPSFLIMPVYSGQNGEVAAVLNLSHKETGEVFDTNDANILSTMLVDISFNMENALLHAKMAEYIKDIEERNIRLEQEIAVRRHAEISLKKSETRFRELADLLPQPVFETDRNDSLIFTNRAAFELFGYTRKDFEDGQSVIHMFIPEDRDRVSENVRKILNGENVGGVEYTALKKDGDTFPVIVYANSVRQENKIIGLRGIAVDIAEQKRVEEMQKKLQEDLIQVEKLAAVGILAAGIAHEVKNPLAIIIQGVEYLKTSVASDAGMVDIVEKINKSALRADSIVKGLLSFTRQMPIQAEEAEIAPIIEETLSFTEHHIESKRITIIRQFSPDVPKVTIDSNQIKQVFVNVLLNSVEAMQDGGTITISTNSIKTEADQDCLQIVFADTGCGIPADKIEKVFDPFYTTSNTLGNTGLGLSITKGIIDKHHGTIRIESDLEKGTRVIIRLPAGNTC
ncbi:MAG: ATP-binding protein [Syntrophales bacterium]